MMMENKDEHYVCIRGIYATALTKLFLDAGYFISFPSKAIQERFNISYEPERYRRDIEIKDREDKQGISITMKENVWNSLKKRNFSDFPLSLKYNDQLFKPHSVFNEHDIFRGVVIKSNKNKNYSFIKLLPKEKKGLSGKLLYNLRDQRFQTNTGYYGGYLPEGKKMIFQVLKGDYGSHAANIVKGFTLPGDLLVIVPKDSNVNISRKIKDSQVRKKFLEFGNKLIEDKDYGIIFRTSAKFSTKQEIKTDQILLEDKLRRIQEKISDTKGEVGRLYSEFKTFNLIFSSQIKQELDRIRKHVIPTINKHHTIKSCSKRKKRKKKYDGRTQILLDYTEQLLTIIPDMYREVIKQFYLDKYYERIQKGTWMNIEHLKLSGESVQLTGGKIERLSKALNRPLKLTVKRHFSGEGRYDGLNIPIEEGDYALSHFTEHKWYYLNEYYSKEGELKGKYININTPIEVSNRAIHYVDLELDIIEKKNGKREIIDSEELESLVNLEIISPTLYNKIIELTQMLKISKYIIKKRN